MASLAEEASHPPLRASLAVPSLARAGILWSPERPGPALQYKEAELAAHEIGLKLLSLPVGSPEDFEPAIEAGCGGGGARRAPGAAFRPRGLDS
jgi:hypothetical protein